MDNLMMFSSDQRFLISGDSRESLTIALKCALTMSNDLTDRDNRKVTRVGSFCLHPSYGIVLGNNYSDDQPDRSWPEKLSDDILFQKYPMPMTVEMIVEHVLQYLNSKEAYVIRKNMPHDDGDGTCKDDAWEVHYPRSFCFFRTIIAIRPSYTYYAK